MIIIVASLTISANVAQGQSPDAPAPSPSETTLYAHAPATQDIGWMNTLPDDGEPDTPLFLFPDDNIDAAGAASAAPVTVAGYQIELPLTPGLTEGLKLDPDGTIEINAHVGGGIFTAGYVSVGTRIMSGDTEVAIGSPSTKPVYPAQANGELYIQWTWSLEVLVDELPADQPLTWVLEGSAIVGNNLYLSTYESRGRSYVTLPITGVLGGGGGGAGGGGAAVLDTDADGLNDTWEEEHFGNLTANATDDPDADGCDNACEFAAGTDPNVADTDGDGISDGDEIAAGGDPLDPSDGTTDTGNMTTDDSDGSTTDAPPDASGDDEDTLAAPDDGSSATDEAGDEGKDSPGFGLVALLAALGTAMVLARRGHRRS